MEMMKSIQSIEGNQRINNEKFVDAEKAFVHINYRLDALELDGKMKQPPSVVNVGQQQSAHPTSNPH